MNEKAVVVCAACKFKDVIYCGARHFDMTMWGQIKATFGNEDKIPKTIANAEQGFIDQWGRFLTREQAFIVASQAGQLSNRIKTDYPNSTTLYSEDLY